MPRAAVEDLWEAFNDVAEGFGIDVDELKEIFVILQEPLDMAKKPLASLTDALFKAFDTDEVGLVAVYACLLSSVVLMTTMYSTERLDRCIGAVGDDSCVLWYDHRGEDRVYVCVRACPCMCEGSTNPPCVPTVLFNIYDFDESGELTIDEVTLCLKSTLSGLAKVSNDVPPLEPDIELVAQDVRTGSSVVWPV